MSEARTELEREVRKIEDRLAAIRSELSVLDRTDIEQFAGQYHRLVQERQDLYSNKDDLLENIDVFRKIEHDDLQAKHRELERANAEDAAFWFRRFFTTLGIANAGAFAALASGLLQADKPADIAPIAAPAMVQFAWGMLTAGSIPLLLWLRYGADDWLSDKYEQGTWVKRARIGIKLLSQALMCTAAVYSIWDFAMGLFMALGSIQGIIKH